MEVQRRSTRPTVWPFGVVCLINTLAHNYTELPIQSLDFYRNSYIHSAILVPLDSVHFIGQNMDRSHNPEFQKWVDDSSKITFMFPLITWLVDSRLHIDHDYVFASVEETPTDTNTGGSDLTKHPQ
jgi:hypothetical protein